MNPNQVLKRNVQLQPQAFDNDSQFTGPRKRFNNESQNTQRRTDMDQSQIEEEKRIKKLNQKMEYAVSVIDPRSITQTHIYLIVNGQIESAQIQQLGYHQIQYKFQHGFEWEQISGMSNGYSQQGAANLYNQTVFNLPIDGQFRSKIPLGWPQLIISVYGEGLFGNNILIGNGSVHIPLQSGRVEKEIYIYQSGYQSIFDQLMTCFKNQASDYQMPDKAFFKGEGREVTKVQILGKLKINFDIMTRNLTNFGFQYN